MEKIAVNKARRLYRDATDTATCGALRATNRLEMRRATRTRGVAMIEYVILAAIVIGLGILLREQLTNVFKRILGGLSAF